MNEVWVVFVAELLRRVRTRAFWIVTLVGVAAISFITAIPTIMQRQLDRTVSLAVVADSGLARSAAMLLRKEFAVVAVTPPQRKAPDKEFLHTHGDADAAVVLRRAGEGIAAEVYARDLNAFPAPKLRSSLRPLNVALATGLRADKVSALSNFPFTVHGVGTKFADLRSTETAANIGILATMLLYLSLIISAQAVMSAVAEEKTSRIAELLVATIDPSRLLAGKVLAAGVIGIGQVVLWTQVAGMIAAATLPRLQALPIAGGELLLLLTFFVVGFFEYAMLMAAGASLINRTEELGTVTGPLVMPLIAAVMLSSFALSLPSSPVIVTASFIPLISPLVMFARIVVAAVPPWQIAACVALNLLALWVIFVIAGRVYRVGMLLYGRPPTFAQIVATLRG